ncbi:MAG: hypothetical protein ACHQ9S_27095 [Candidatus Binatia bacterium]
MKQRCIADEPSPAESDGRVYMRMALTLADPVRPAHRLPMLMRRALPDPLTEAGWARLHHADLAVLTPAQKLAERARLLLAVGSCDREPPTWLIDRLRRLEVA